MTYLNFTRMPSLIRQVHAALGDSYSPNEIDDAMFSVQIAFVDEIDMTYVVDVIRDEIPLLEDAD